MLGFFAVEFARFFAGVFASLLTTFLCGFLAKIWPLFLAGAGACAKERFPRPCERSCAMGEEVLVVEVEEVPVDTRDSSE